MSTQPDTLHDRITALTFAADDGTEYEHNGHAPSEGEPECPACWAASIRAVLSETTTARPETCVPAPFGDCTHWGTVHAQPEADAVERAARAMYEREHLTGKATWEALTAEADEWPDGVCAYLARRTRDQARAALAAAQPVEHGMLPGSHERSAGPECRCGSAWDAWHGRCAAQPVEPACLPSLPHGDGPISENTCALHGQPWPCMRAQPVEPEPDERKALHGVLSRTPLADGSRLGGQSRTNLVESLIAAGFRRSRPEATPERDATPDEAHDIGYTKGHTDGYREGWAEATHTVTLADRGRVMGALYRAWLDATPAELQDALAPAIWARYADAALAALGVTVADTPTQAGDDA